MALTRMQLTYSANTIRAYGIVTFDVTACNKLSYVNRIYQPISCCDLFKKRVPKMCRKKRAMTSILVKHRVRVAVIKFTEMFLSFDEEMIDARHFSFYIILLNRI